MASQAAPRGGNRLYPHALWKHYTVFDGLAGMRVEDICQDHRGFIWVATGDGGVSRFDGIHFDNLTCDDGLPHPAVTGIQETDDGLVWLATFGGGLAAYDGRSFKVYTTEEGLPSNELLGLRRARDGSLLVPTRNGLAKFGEGAHVETITSVGGEAIGLTYDVLTDASGTTWLATLDRGVISTDGQHIGIPAEDGPGKPCWAWSLAMDVGRGCACVPI